jgi:hypothetical protein
MSGALVGELRRLNDAARSAPSLWLPKAEPHPAGTWVGIASGGLLAVAGLREWPWLGWLALGGAMAGMLLHWRLLRRSNGWQLDFAARTAVRRPVGDDAVHIDGPGWAIAVAPGDRRSTIAIDLRHAEVGRVARLYDTPGRAGVRVQRLLSELADTLAARLAIERSGPRL